MDVLFQVNAILYLRLLYLEKYCTMYVGSSVGELLHGFIFINT